MDFRIEFGIQEDQRAFFVLGSEIRFTIHVVDNPLSIVRQLKAVAHMTRSLHPNHPDYDLQQDPFGTELETVAMPPLLSQCE
jgi:hypothetical protein